MPRPIHIIHIMSRAGELIRRRPGYLLVSAAYLFTLTIEMINYLVGHDVRLVVFYFPALFLLTWFVSVKSAVLLAGISSLLWFLIGFDLLALTSLEHAWNAFMRFVIFLTFIYIVRAYRRERAFARQDFLTKIANTQHFTERADIEIERCRRYRRPFSVVYMDIDDFKKINDTQGHREGDELLFKVAQTVRKNIRAADTVARLGGDEFAILLPETDFEAASRLAQKIRVLLLEAIRDRAWQCTFSFGLVTFLIAPAGFDEMIRRADELMYRAKSEGKNRVIARQYSPGEK